MKPAGFVLLATPRARRTDRLRCQPSSRPGRGFRLSLTRSVNRGGSARILRLACSFCTCEIQAADAIVFCWSPRFPKSAG